MNYKRILFQGLLALAIFSCGGNEVGPAGKNSLVKITEEPGGSNCANGGQKIESGIDLDANGQLSNEEIGSTEYVCNGKNSLINIVLEQPGNTCAKGGVKIETGLDSNGNGILESEEVSETKFVCSIQNGLSSLTIYTDEPVGNNCASGGFKLEVGLDLNGNLVLDSDEIQSTKYICLPKEDKQERIDIGESNVGTNFTDWYIIEYHTFHLIKFNKLNYPDVDSITFVPSIYTSDPSTTAFVELYNLSDSVAINNSLLTSNTNDWIFKESRNIYDQLPNKEITLAIRLKSDNPDPNYWVSTGIRSYLFIYRH